MSGYLNIGSRAYRSISFIERTAPAHKRGARGAIPRQASIKITPGILYSLRAITYWQDSCRHRCEQNMYIPIFTPACLYSLLDVFFGDLNGWNGTVVVLALATVLTVT